MLHELRTIDGFQPSTVRSNVFHPLVVTDQYQETDTFQQLVEIFPTAVKLFLFPMESAIESFTNVAYSLSKCKFSDR